jgi:hypothetical protein
MKNPISPPGIEPATFLLAAQCLDQLRHHEPTPRLVQTSMPRFSPRSIHSSYVRPLALETAWASERCTSFSLFWFNVCPYNVIMQTWDTVVSHLPQRLAILTVLASSPQLHRSVLSTHSIRLRVDLSLLSALA